jgi:exonuclease V gamma subunit
LREEEEARVLLLDGFMDLTKLEEEFIKYLVFSFEDVFALAYYDPYEEDPNFLPKEFSDFLLSLSSFSIVKVKGSEDWRKRREMNFFAFPSREEEVEWIARSIREVASERKVPLHKILVTFPDLESYSGIIERVFKKHRIPFTIYPSLFPSFLPGCLAGSCSFACDT